MMVKNFPKTKHFSRLAIHFQNNQSFAIFPLEKEHYSEDEHKDRMTFAKKKAQSLGRSFLEFLSKWSEKEEEHYESFLVIFDLSKENAMRICQKLKLSRFLYRKGDKCEEISATCAVEEDDRVKWDILRLFSCSEKALSNADLCDLFSTRKEVSFDSSSALIAPEEVFEIIMPRPSYFQSISRLKRIF